MAPEPERSCIVTHAVKEKGELIRFVVGPGNVLVADLSGKLPGRGLYVLASRLTLAEAISKKTFSRAAKTQVTIPEGLMAQVESQLARRVGEALSLARKSGQVVIGFDQVEAAIKTGKVEALVHAADAGADGIKKLSAYKGPVFTQLSRERLSEVLGKENAVHAAVIHGPMAPFFLEEARRFALFLD